MHVRRDVPSDVRSGDGIGELRVKGEVYCNTSKNFYLGYYSCSAKNLDHSIGLIEVSGDGMIVTNTPSQPNVTLKVGYQPRSEGTVRLLDNAIFRFKPSWQATDIPTFGVAEDSVAYLTMSNNAILKITTNNGIDFGVGERSRAFVDLADNANCYAAAALNVAKGTDTEVDVKLSGTAVLQTGTALNVASGESSSAKIRIRDSAELLSAWSTTVAGGSGSSADIVLEGGKMGVQPVAPNNILNFGTDTSVARISGYGKVATCVYQTSGKNWYLQLEMNGQVVADGMGASRTLDLGLFMNVNNATYARTGHGNVCGTNGWYAVNGGRLVMPQYLEVTNASWCVGDYPMAAAPSFAGSFKVDFAAKPTQAYLHASLYAADHADVPAGLPEETSHLCVEDVWHLGYGDGRTTNNGWDTSEPTSAVDFGSADLTFRFGARSVKRGKRYAVTAWKYDFASSKWVAVSKADYDPANPTVTFSSVTPSSDGVSKWNMGWYAVTLEQYVDGAMLILR